MIPVGTSADTRNSVSHAGEAAAGSFLSRVTSTLVVLGTAVSVLSAGENPQQAFAKNWEGRTVVLRRDQADPLIVLIESPEDRR
jgi:hypothetical protein